MVRKPKHPREIENTRHEPPQRPRRASGGVLRRDRAGGIAQAAVAALVAGAVLAAVAVGTMQALRWGVMAVAGALAAVLEAI